MTRRERLAYAAGLLDGEGTITIQRIRNKSGSFSYQPKVLIVNTDIRLIQAFHDVIGCGIVYQSTADKSGVIPDNWNPVHRLQVVSLQARQTIALLRPFLIAKAAHCDVIERMPIRGKSRKDRSLVPAQAACFDEITALNRRGRKIAPVDH